MLARRALRACCEHAVYEAVVVKGIVMSFHQQNRKFFLRDCNLSSIKLYIIRPFQERRAIARARARAHTRAKVFRRVINRTRK